MSLIVAAAAGIVDVVVVVVVGRRWVVCGWLMVASGRALGVRFEKDVGRRTQHITHSTEIYTQTHKRHTARKYKYTYICISPSNCAIETAKGIFRLLPRPSFSVLDIFTHRANTQQQQQCSSISIMY